MQKSNEKIMIHKLQIIGMLNKVDAGTKVKRRLADGKEAKFWRQIFSTIDQSGIGISRKTDFDGSSGRETFSEK